MPIVCLLITGIKTGTNPFPPDPHRSGAEGNQVAPTLQYSCEQPHCLFQSFLPDSWSVFSLTGFQVEWLVSSLAAAEDSISTSL